MLKYLLCLICCFFFKVGLAQNSGFIQMDTARFNTGEQDNWKDPGFNDASWKVLKTGEVWQIQGFPDYHGYAWYRIHINIPSSLKNKGAWRDSLRINLAHVNDVDETYLNGVKIGKTGSYPTDPEGYVSKWPAVRNYCLAVNNPAIKWDQENVIAIKVYDGGGTGGIFMGTPFIDMLEKTDGIEFNKQPLNFLSPQKADQKLQFTNKFNTTINGVLDYNVTDAAAKRLIKHIRVLMELSPFGMKEILVEFPHREGIEITYSFKEQQSGKTIGFTEVSPYILTPDPLKSPVINGAAVLGATAGHSILYKIPVSGVLPVIYSVSGLPAGLRVDGRTGIITGIITRRGVYKMELHAKNSYGTYSKTFTIKIGDLLALTPPMGWNSWNCWGLSVSADKVKSSANALVEKGLIDYGWVYINIDDVWEAAQRADNGEIHANNKFPDMKGLGDYLHSKGLKFGIYSSPGTKTCGGFLGSLEHECQDAATYSSWGIDYLKYDLCSYLDSIGNDTTLLAQQVPYRVMRDKLRQQQRDIVYSMCQYGIKDVWKWGRQMNGNSWRTTEDINDTWESLRGTGFKQDKLYPYARPGGWNDPDMLIVGMVGWGESLHPTRLTPYEQYTHISLWSLLSAPLLIGCDISKLDDFTLNLLKNKEVLDIDQDELGRQARKIVDKDNYQVWIKDMADGSQVIGIFNMNDQYGKYIFKLNDAGLSSKTVIRDVWRQSTLAKDVNNIAFNIPPHGVRLLRISKL